MRTKLMIGLAVTMTIMLFAGCKKEDFRLPTVETAQITAVTINSATGGVNVTDDGDSQISSLGLCYSTTNIEPTTADSKKSATNGVVNLTGLTSGTSYYVRAYAINKTGTGYGQVVRFTTTFETVSDRQGNVYKFTTIGTQTWMVENLRTTVFNDGSPIANKTGNSDWSRATSSTIPAYCWYNNDQQTHKATYGALYNGFAAINTKLCPTGWHVPTENEFAQLFTFLGGNNLTGGKMKAAGPNSGWQNPNAGADNSSNFSALPGGFRGDSTTGGTIFENLHIEANFWTSSDYNSMGAKAIKLSYDKAYVQDNVLYNKAYGFSVRCVKN